jgi:hypothetical protein
MSHILLEKCPGQYSDVKMKKGQLLQNYARQSYGSIALLHVYLLRSIYLQSFLVIPLMVSEL